MSIDILTDTADQEAVRIVLGVDTKDVSDTVLQSVVGIPAGELIVKSRITNWADVLAGADEDTDRLKLGCIYFTAAVLIPRLRNILREFERIGELGLGRINWERMIEHLQSLGNIALGDIGSGDDELTVFTVMGPSRKYRELKELDLEDTAEFQNV